MPPLTIDLQDGFANDEVAVRVGGAEVFRKREVTTDLSASLAASCQTEAPDQAVEVEVAVPSRGLRGAVEIDASQTPYLGVSISEGRLLLRPSETMFFYL